MHVSEVLVERLVNTGNYENERLGLKIVVQKAENPADAIRRGKDFLDRFINQKSTIEARQRNLDIVANPKDYTGNAVEKAQKWLEDNPEQEIVF